MRRIARIIATGYPHHVMQRGNNCATTFIDDEDRKTQKGGTATKRNWRVSLI